MKKVIYVNRYGDKIQFEDKKYTVEMTGYNPEWMRYGFANNPDGTSTMNTDNEIIDMIDPSGGPYITLGTDLRLFFRDKKSRIVKAINIFPNLVEFIIE